MATEDEPRSGAGEGDRAPETTQPKLLTGGNPQIPKGDGDGPVQAYIEAMPGWKRGVGRRLDGIIERHVPDLRKGVRWNSAFYGTEERGWFLSFRCFTKYVKVSFFNGQALEPRPPIDAKDEGTRYFHIHEDDELDEDVLAAWVEQASKIPGWDL